MSEDVDLWGGAICGPDLTRIGFVARVEERSGAADHGCGDPAAMVRIAQGLPPRAASGGNRPRKAARRRRADRRIVAARSAAAVSIN
jgi:hypothetical protein